MDLEDPSPYILALEDRDTIGPRGLDAGALRLLLAGVLEPMSRRRLLVRRGDDDA
ncbi:hypothetical protein [Tautonia sociabilis]|uniref:hypothetical protein n=1 Tax=Tautonia sociabilis TaxID=2080755 RepID=UPI0013157DA8|nr:hypothetical protein [Tautonia sociabilis]